MPTFLAGLGQQAATEATQGILGLALGSLNDKRQLKQQARLTEQQMKYDQMQTDWNMKKQIELFNATGYGAQLDQIKKAGLSAGLIYGGGGAGGQSTNVNTASVHGANAPVGGGEAIQMQQLGLQMAMQKAQIDNINADTKNKEAQTPNINADTNKKLSEIELLKEQTTNTHVKTALDKVELNIQQLNQQFQAETYADRVNLITWTANKMVNEWKQAENQTYISEKTRDTVITTIQRECIQKLLQNELLKSQNTKTQTETQLTAEQIKKVQADTELIIQTAIQVRMNNKWIDIKAEDEHLKTMLQQKMTDWNTDDNQRTLQNIMQIIHAAGSLKYPNYNTESNNYHYGDSN